MAATGIVLIAAGAHMSPGQAAEFNPTGDGSDANNLALLAEAGATGCENCVLEGPPHEWDDPFFDLDWSLALRGAYVRDNNGEHYEVLVVPSVALQRDTVRGGYEISGGAELTKATEDEYRLQSMDLSFEGDYALDEVSGVRGDLELAVTQDDPNVSGGVAVEPAIISGSGEFAANRRFGRFAVEGRARAERTIHGPSTLVGGAQQDNSTLNNWDLGGGLRLGFEVTPVLTAFVDGSIGHQFYDAPSPTYLVKLDATDYQLRTGLAAQFHETLAAEVSVGLGLRRFAEPVLGEVTATLYDASLTYRPDETVTLEAAFATSIGAPGPDTGGSARIEYEATGQASYQVNPWLRLRSSVGWRQARLVGVTTTENGYGVGAGLDYLLNQHAALTADYGYSREETTPDPVEDEQRVTLGITLSR